MDERRRSRRRAPAGADAAHRFGRTNDVQSGQRGSRPRFSRRSTKARSRCLNANSAGEGWKRSGPGAVHDPPNSAQAAAPGRHRDGRQGRADHAIADRERVRPSPAGLWDNLERGGNSLCPTVSVTGMDPAGQARRRRGAPALESSSPGCGPRCQLTVNVPHTTTPTRSMGSKGGFPVVRGVPPHDDAMAAVPVAIAPCRLTRSKGSKSVPHRVPTALE